MNQPKLLRSNAATENFLAAINRREVALWIDDIPIVSTDVEKIVQFIGLPWHAVLSEASDSNLISALEKNTDADDPAVRKRGFIQIVDGDLSQIELPRRCLPVYLLNGRQDVAQRSFQSRYRRMSMLEGLRRSGAQQLLVISSGKSQVYEDLKDLWSAGFCPALTFLTAQPNGYEKIKELVGEFADIHAAAFLDSTIDRFVTDTLTQFVQLQSEDRTIIRVRNRSGEFSRLDVTNLDDPAQPLLDYYDIIQEQHLSPLMPEQLQEEGFVSFFKNPEESWTPYAADLPWQRNDSSLQKLRTIMGRLDSAGPNENSIAYITAVPGAGGTTLARTLAWKCAQEGYPVLVARNLPFDPEPVSVGSFLNRVRVNIETLARSASDTTSSDSDKIVIPASRYEVPWVIVFDRMHWEYRDTELRRFRNEMTRQGRPVCILVVSGPIREFSYYDETVFKEIENLDHQLDYKDVLALGEHLNRFLKVYGKPRDNLQWQRFHREHAVERIEGITAFWIALSFWIQGHYDLSESIQEWMYKCFKNKIDDKTLRVAILQIAAMSSMRLPMIERLLPVHEKWPTAQLLEDKRSELGPLGLVRIPAGSDQYWALVHDVLGRFLIAALYHDSAMLKEVGLEAAANPDHLRFLLLAQVAQKPELGENSLRSLGEDFATTILKLDPDHGHAEFVPFWKDVLKVLDSMPQSLQRSSRVFRHHTAISRRRITTLDKNLQVLYDVNIKDKITLLKKAIEDVKYALEAIDFVPGSEPSIHLHNSLSHAYRGLAKAQESNGVPKAEIDKLLLLASHAALRAYEENPASAYAVETYVLDLLDKARSDSTESLKCCIEAMNILFTAISSDEETYRRAHLGRLADQALELLVKCMPALSAVSEPSGPTEVLTKAWLVMIKGVEQFSEIDLSEFPEENRILAIEALSHPEGKGNNQVIRLTYDLVSNTYPYNYSSQLEQLEQLTQTGYRLTAQMRLEYAILLYQLNRTHAADKEFYYLRKLWRETEQFVRIPDRLRWLRNDKNEQARTVQAVVASDWNQRAMAKVREFQNISVPFRPEEFGMSMKNLHPGAIIQCHVSFGHNGPFLRPVTAYSSV